VHEETFDDDDEGDVAQRCVAELILTAMTDAILPQTPEDGQFSEQDVLCTTKTKLPTSPVPSLAWRFPKPDRSLSPPSRPGEPPRVRKITNEWLEHAQEKNRKLTHDNEEMEQVVKYAKEVIDGHREISPETFNRMHEQAEKSISMPAPSPLWSPIPRPPQQ